MKNERLRIVLILTAALLLAALFLWSLTLPADAQGVCDAPCQGFCDELDESYPAPTSAPATETLVAVDAGRTCIPTHAGAPVRLCPTGSGSGWWVYDSETGQILQDDDGRLAHVPHIERLPAGEDRTLFASDALVAVWIDRHVVVSTRYADGKPYVFSVFEAGRVVHWEW